MRAVRLECEAVGDDNRPQDGTSDEDVVRWCLKRGAILVTADRARKSPEMRIALRRHRVPVVRLVRPVRAVPLLRGLLNAWDEIEAAHATATRRERQMTVTLDHVTGRISRVRRGG